MYSSGMTITDQSAPATTPNTTQDTISVDVDAWLRDGYLACEGLVSPAELAELESEILALARGRYDMANYTPPGPEVSDAEAMAAILCVHQPHAVSPLINKFVHHPGLVSVLSQITAVHLAPGWWDGGVKCMQSMFFAKGPGKPGQAWHQDEIYIPTRDRSLIGAWIAVDDATIDNGCLWVLPGSHRPGVLYPQRAHNSDQFDVSEESYGFDDSAEIPVEVPAGSVVFFNGYLLHRSKPNRSQRFRRALVNHYMSGASFLPWGNVGEHDRVATGDLRAVTYVAGEDPYPWKPIIPLPEKPHLRAERPQSAE